MQRITAKEKKKRLLSMSARGERLCGLARGRWWRCCMQLWCILTNEKIAYVRSLHEKGTNEGAAIFLTRRWRVVVLFTRRRSRQAGRAGGAKASGLAQGSLKTHDPIIDRHATSLADQVYYNPGAVTPRAHAPPGAFVATC